MLKMLTSASRVVLLIITLAFVAGFLIGKIDPKDFMIIVSMVFAFYFNKPQGNAGDEETK